MPEPIASRLVNAPSPDNRPADEPDRLGVFTSPQSLTTFAGASAVVSVVWGVLGSVFPDWGGSKAALLGVVLLVGALIYLISEPPGGTWRDRLVGLGVAVINSFLLAAAALGLHATKS